MTVTGLWTAWDKGRMLPDRIRLSCLRHEGYCIGVDAYALLYRFSMKAAEQVTSNTDTTIITSSCYDLIRRIILSGLRPIFVFDGRSPSMVCMR